jgi:protein-tyrosine phosphatase
MACSQRYNNRRGRHTHTEPVRRASTLIPSTFNSRQVGRGGAPLIRSDAPTQIDADGRAVIKALGVRTAIDLRQRVERELDPVDLGGLEIDVRQVPILGDKFDVNTTMSLEQIYIALLEHRGAALTAAVRVLCEPEALPALVFCSAGKDRTGLVIALTLAALGVPDEQIVNDYALTEQAMANGFRAVIERRALAAGISQQEMAVKVGAPPDLMRSVLGWLRAQDGGAAGYLHLHGLTDQELVALRLTTPP